MIFPDIILSYINKDFVIIDSTFPQKNPYAFRNVEINEYLKIIKNSSACTMYKMDPGPEAWFHHSYGMTPEQFLENKKGYLSYYPQNKSRVYLLNKKRRYRFKLAYSFFLAETYVLLPFLEKNKIPFVFVLYPGGGFGIGNDSSDSMLKKIFSSDYFRGVITTQNITKNYLIKNKMCNKNNICNIYGGFVQFKKDEILNRRYYNQHKDTLDICFVAAKYSENGVDKGYDAFIEVAKHLSKDYKNIRFHVVGGFNEDDIDVQDIKQNIIFYGYQNKEFLAKFYRDMDIFLSPARPYKLFPGNFDGFPLGIDASFCGVAMLVTDFLNMNENRYIENKEISIINDNVEDIINKVLFFYNNPDKLSQLALNGQIKTQELFDIDMQINRRIKFFEKYINLKR